MVFDGFLPSHYALQIFISYLWKLDIPSWFCTFSENINVGRDTYYYYYFFFFIISYNLIPYLVHISLYNGGLSLQTVLFLFFWRLFAKDTCKCAQNIVLPTHKVSQAVSFNKLNNVYIYFLNEKTKNSNRYYWSTFFLSRMCININIYYIQNILALYLNIEYEIRG